MNWKPIMCSIYTGFLLGVIVSCLFIFSAMSGFLSPSPGQSSSIATTSQISDASPVNASLSTNSTSREIYPSKKKPMPPLDTFKLTKELVAKRVKDNAIILTFGNYAFKDFIITWYKHLFKLEIHNVLVGAVDMKLLEALYLEDIPVFYIGSNVSDSDLGWGSLAFHKLGREKTSLLIDVLPFGYDILFSDTDVVWLQNPFPYFAHYPEADILTSTDELVPSYVDDSLGNWEMEDGAFNIGIFYWRSTKNCIEFAKTWGELLAKDDSIWDQSGFNDLLRKKLGPSVPNSEGLFYAFDKKLKLGLLPSSVFCNGHTYFVQAMPEQLKLRPYAVHTTFQFSGTEGKRHRLREAMLFKDPEDYYDVPEGFLTFKPLIPKELLFGSTLDVDGHFELVNYQIKQIRTALSIAQILGRTLVMPPLWCILDRFWFNHPGIVAGSLTRQPFLCPLDHVFDVHGMLQKKPVEEFGPSIGFREYSFLDNPALPKRVKDSWLDVRLVDNPSANLASSGILRLQKNSTEETLRRVFSSFRNVKVIRFLSMQNAFQGFEDEKIEMKFRKRVKLYVSMYCCVMDHNPGHIYYDMYWDEKPNWRPIPPSSWSEDHPPN